MKRFSVGHTKLLWLVATLFIARITFGVVGEEGWILEAWTLALLTVLIAFPTLDQFIKTVTIDSRKIVVTSLFKRRELKFRDIGEVKLLDERFGLSGGLVLVASDRQSVVINPIYTDYLPLIRVVISMTITGSIVLPKIASGVLLEANLGESYRKQADLFARRTFAFGLRSAV